MVEKFTYLGCLNTYDLDSKKEILVRILKATAALSAMDKIWKSTSIHKKLKLEVLKMYGCEVWTITKVAEANILAFERKCYRKILRIDCMQKVTNAELYRRIDLKNP